jgi:hypothetical protein
VGRESAKAGAQQHQGFSSNYQSIEELKNAVDRYFLERNLRYAQNPKRAGNTIWGRERVKPIFKDSNNCKDPRYG